MILTLIDGDAKYEFELEGWTNTGDVVEELLWAFEPNIKALV